MIFAGEGWTKIMGKHGEANLFNEIRGKPRMTGSEEKKHANYTGIDPR